MPFTHDQLQRYSRQIVLPEVGGRGQRALADACVAIVGLGGLGCPAATSLAAAGVGRLLLIDGDRVELSNLARQPLHGTEDVGRLKVESAAESLRALNPHVTVEPIAERLRPANAQALLAPADVVLDGSDNFMTRYALNDTCLLSRKPLVSAAVVGWDGQLTVFPNREPGAGPCYRCLFPEPPPPNATPSCRTNGVLGATAAVMGNLQAGEALRLLLGAGEPLAGRFLHYDALQARFREIKLHPRPGCRCQGG